MRSVRTVTAITALVTCTLFGSGCAKIKPGAPPVIGSFAKFDADARLGKRLTVVFLGASLTWGANATCQARTSYRARVAQKFETRYPEAHFTFIDGAIGGTGSDLGVFRLQRDCLQYDPDLVFLDFSANDNIWIDGPNKLATYESLVRRIVAQCPVVSVIFPFKWLAEPGMADTMPGRVAHIKIAEAYNAPVGDAILHTQNMVKQDAGIADRIWNIDPIHPGDYGYQVFADVAWQAFIKGVDDGMVCAAPAEMLHADTYMSWSRNRISQLKQLPDGWQPGLVSRTAANYDWLMSRWLDDVVIVRNESSTPVEPLIVNFRATSVLVFGEGRKTSGRYLVFVDGESATWQNGEVRDAEFNPADKGDAFHYAVIATNLNPVGVHRLEIRPLFEDKGVQQLRLESICLAGGEARIVE